MLDDPFLLLIGFVLAVVFGRYLQAGYATGTAALANRLRPRHEAPSAAALRLRGIEPEAGAERRPDRAALGATAPSV